MYPCTILHRADAMHPLLEIDKLECTCAASTPVDSPKKQTFLLMHQHNYGGTKILMLGSVSFKGPPLLFWAASIVVDLKNIGNHQVSIQWRVHTDSFHG